MRLEGATALITGADGFIGSHLTEALAAKGAHVKAFCWYNSLGSRGWLDHMTGSNAADVEFILGDIRDAATVRSASVGCDVIFHLAALIGIPYSYRAPDSYVATNVGGTLNVLQAARDLDVARVVVTSTSEVYGTAMYVPIDERHPLQGQSPYSASKIGADKMAEAFARTYQLPVVTVRPFNTYGPRQSARAIIPTIISQLVAGRSNLELGLLSPTRDFNYVSDTCEAFLALGECDEAVGREVNVGSGKEISIGDLAQMIAGIWGSRVTLSSAESRLRPPASEVERLVANSSLMHGLTGWSPQVSLRDGLTRTIAWFSEPGNLSKYRAGLYAV